jgi:hypothetical protein
VRARPRLRTATDHVRSTVAVVGLLVVLAIPLVVALIVLRAHRWYPVAELAQTELRLRDVGTRHIPLTGVFSPRIAGFDGTTSHPGPLPLLLMWPAYQLLGATSWAMQAASVLTHVAAMGVCLWIARRRGGLPVVLGCAVLLAVLVGAYGASTLTQAWNPYLPLLWWAAFLLAVWSVVCGDLPLLPVACFAGSYCTQSHVAYAGITVALLGLGVVVTIVRTAVRRRRGGTAGSTGRWLAAGSLVLVAVWLPPVLDEVIHDPGNLSALWDYFRDADAPVIGTAKGVRVLLVHLNPWRLPARELVLTMGIGRSAEVGVATGSLDPGLALLAAWLLSVLVAVRLRLHRVLALDLVLATAMTSAAVSMSRIFDGVQYWIVLYAWTIGGLTVLATAWSFATLVHRRLVPRLRPRATTVAAVSAILVIAASTARFAVDARNVTSPLPETAPVMGALVPATVAALDHGPRYLVTWNDQSALDLRGWALFDELERSGFDVNVPPLYRGAARAHRVLAAADADRVVHLENGAGIGTWRRRPGVTQVAEFDPRTPRQRLEYERLRAALVRGLNDAGLSQVVRSVDGKGDDDNLVFAGLNPIVPSRLRHLVDDMLHLGLPTAVFVGPPEPPASSPPA